MIGNKKVGVIGGGQLGMMLIPQAVRLGLTLSFLDSDPNAPGSRYSGFFHQGDPMNYHDVLSFGLKQNAITIEKEEVNTAALFQLADRGIPVFPHPNVIAVIQDRYLQKEFLIRHNLPVAPFHMILGRDDLYRFKDALPLCMKKCRSGYDGKGVMMLQSEADFDKAFDEPSILETVVNIDREISVIVSRDRSGNIAVYDPVEMVFKKGAHILSYLAAPAMISAQQKAHSVEIARHIAKAFDLVGIMAVEMFIDDRGALYVNELAPRPHNSGHHTIEANETSQFEQLLRIVSGLPLGSIAMKSKAVMMNLLQPGHISEATMGKRLADMMSQPDVFIHWYNKQWSVPNRKLGHITLTGQNMNVLIQKTKELYDNIYDAE